MSYKALGCQPESHKKREVQNSRAGGILGGIGGP